MDFKVELNNIDYSDNKLIKALDVLSDSIEYKVEMSYEEIDDMASEYLLKELDIYLDVSNMYVESHEGRLYYDNIFEASIITNQMLQHFGNSLIHPGGASELQYYYEFNPVVFIKKLSKFGYIENDGYKISITFNQADEFTNTWIYKYIQNKKGEM